MRRSGAKTRAAQFRPCDRERHRPLAKLVVVPADRPFAHRGMDDPQARRPAVAQAPLTAGTAVIPRFARIHAVAPAAIWTPSPSRPRKSAVCQIVCLT